MHPISERRKEPNTGQIKKLKINEGRNINKVIKKDRERKKEGRIKMRGNE
jgi:hypothetical protein